MYARHRSAYLVDAVFLNRETLARLVGLLRQHPFPQFARIRGLDIGDGAQSYILDHDTLVQKVRSDTETGWSGSKSSTRFITVRDGVNTIASKDDGTVQSLIEFLSATFLPVATTALLSIPPADTASPVALAGYLLDYPFTYTCLNHPLSFEVLHQIRVSAFPPSCDQNEGRKSNGEEAPKERVLVTSFTIPAGVMEAAGLEMEMVIERTKQKFEDLIKMQSGWSGLIVETTDVCLPSVTL